MLIFFMSKTIKLFFLFKLFFKKEPRTLNLEEPQQSLNRQEYLQS